MFRTSDNLLTQLNFRPLSINVGDFNGDGKDDLILTKFVSNSAIRETVICYSNGSNFNTIRKLGNQHPWYINNFQIADFNNDGISDILYQTRGSYSQNELVINHNYLFKSQGIALEVNDPFIWKQVITAKFL